MKQKIVITKQDTVWNLGDEAQAGFCWDQGTSGVQICNVARYFRDTEQQSFVWWWSYEVKQPINFSPTESIKSMILATEPVEIGNYGFTLWE